MFDNTIWTCDGVKVRAGMRTRVAQAGRHHQQSTDDDDGGKFSQCGAYVVSANNKNKNEQSWAFEGDKFVHSELEIKEVYLLWIGAEAKNWRENVFQECWVKNMLNWQGKNDFALKAHYWPLLKCE